MNGRLLRADAAWMNRATTSLPVPDSPVTSTVVSVEATCVALRSTSRHSTDSPTTRRWVPAARLIDPSLHARVDPLRTGVVDLMGDVADLAADAPRPRWYAIRRASGTCARLNASGRFDQNATRTTWLRCEGRHAQDRAVAGADQPLHRVRGGGCARRP